MELDRQQKKAVESDSARALVLAGAGSGKTRVLIERIAYLIEKQKVSPYEVIAFTFTRKAAGEIKKRLEERIGSAAHKVTCGTMHGIALEFVTQFGEIIGMRKNPTVYCEWEEQFLLREVATDMGLYKRKAWRIPQREIAKIFADYYQRGITPEPFQPGYKLFYSFIDRCRENNALTYGGLLVGLELLIDTINKYKQFRHILVDEVQDIDAFQWKIISLMEITFGANLFVVGDIDQSIYEWRGAVPEYLVRYQKEFDIYRLETNYRSDPRIVEAANNIIEHNTRRLPKKMRPAHEKIEPVAISILENRDTAVLSKDVKEAEYYSMDGGVAVLSRSHVMLEKLSMLLGDYPHEYIGRRARLTNSEKFRRFHAFLKLMVNPYDNFSFLLIREFLGLSPEEYKEIRSQAIEAGESHLQIWRGMVAESNPHLHFFESYAMRDSVAACAFSVKSMAQGSVPYPSAGWGWEQEEINIIFRFVFTYLTEHGSSNVKDYLRWLATYDVQDEIPEKAEKLQLMTIHAAKGLEWPTVMVIGCNQGFFPSRMATDDNALEAERRLAYVAWTRAENRLVLCVRPEVKVVNEKVYHSPRSMFLREMEWLPL